MSRLLSLLLLYKNGFDAGKYVKRFAVVHGKKITKKARIEATILNSLTPLSKAEV